MVIRNASFLLAIVLFFVLPVVAADSVQVRVLDPQDAVIPNALVEARDANGRAVGSVMTAGDGTASLNVAIPCEITVQAQGFEILTQRIGAAYTAPLSVRLRPATVRTSVSVVVRDVAQPSSHSTSNLDIERIGARTVFDAVERVVPGAFVTRRGVMGYGISTNGTGTVSIRGIGGSPNTGVLIVVDGRPDYQGLMGHPLPDFYSLSDAGVVNVIEGPASVLYGSNAMGGVVEVKNWEPLEKMTTKLTAGFGSYNTGQYNLTHGARFDKGFYSFNAGVAHTSGDRVSSDFRDQDGTLTAGYDISRNWKASVQGRYGHFHVEDPGPITSPLSNSFANVGRGGFSLNLDNSAGRTWGYARVFSSYGHHYITDGFRSNDRTTGLRVDQSLALLPQLTLEMGTDVVNYGGQAHNPISHLDYGDHHISTAAGFARAQWSATSRLRLQSGMRYENNSQFGSVVAPEAGLSYRLADGYSISADVAKGFRNPTIRELYMFPAPNAALEPERLWNYQASFQAHPIRALTASVTAYYADLSNLIVTTGRYPNLKLQNSGATLNRGVETMARWRVTQRVSIQAGYAYLRSTNLAAYLPAHKFTYSADIDAGRAFLTFGGTTVGERWGNTAHTQKLDNYTLATAKLTLPVARNWRLFAMVDNLFNQDYQVVTGYPMPGVNASGGFTVNF
jgi:iron complex outermembrane receptor protein